MKRFFLLCVTYNSYSELGSYLSSVNHAAAKAKDVEVSVFVADNTETDVQQIDTNFPNLHEVRVFPFNENLGYMGALSRMYNSIDKREPDYVAMTNVDLEMQDDFFLQLSVLNATDDIGWLAPSLISKYEGRDRNPQHRKRMSKRRLQILKFMFRYYPLHYIYHHTLYRRKRLQNNASVRDIYSGHGSFMLLTKAFAQAYPEINYPVFLFCEELFVAELCSRVKLKVVYEPTLRLIDSDHVSTKKMRRPFFYKCNHQAVSFILKEFY